MKKCCICGKEFEGSGNNPYPIKDDGYCCDYCNMNYVLPARIEMTNLTRNNKAMTFYGTNYKIDLNSNDDFYILFINRVKLMISKSANSITDLIRVLEDDYIQL